MRKYDEGKLAGWGLASTFGSTGKGTRSGLLWPQERAAWKAGRALVPRERCPFLEADAVPCQGTHLLTEWEGNVCCHLPLVLADGRSQLVLTMPLRWPHHHTNKRTRTREAKLVSTLTQQAGTGPETQARVCEHASDLPGQGPTSTWGSVVQGCREKQQELTQNCRKVMSLPLPAHAHGHYFKSNETIH